jgi:anti-anti-sigma factor
VTEFEVDDGGTARIALRGELDLATIGPVRTAVDQALEAGAKQVVFELSNVAFLDSSALALFSQTALRVGVTIEQPSDLVRRTIEITGLASLLTVTP